MDRNHSLRNVKADITASDYISRKKSRSIYNTVKSESALKLDSNFDGTIVFDELNTTVNNFRSYDLRYHTVLGNELCDPPATSDCSLSPCNEPIGFQTYNNMYTSRDTSNSFIELFGEYGFGKNDLCKYDLWKRRGAYVKSTNNVLLVPRGNQQYNIDILNCFSLTKNISFT